MNYNILDYAKENKLLLQTAVKNEEFLDFFGKFPIKTIVEIGTHKGLSSAYMAQFAKKIFTFDIKDYKEKYKVWSDFKVEEKIRYFTVSGRNEIAEILKDIKFDFCFIDGSHKYDDVKADFEMVKHCGKVLFHDSAKRKTYGVRKFAKEIGATITGNIAYWNI